MLPLLQKLHSTAAERGDGLRPEFLRMAGEGTPGRAIPSIQAELASVAGDHRAPCYQPEPHHMRCLGPPCGVCAGIVDARCVSQKLQGEHRQ